MKKFLFLAFALVVLSCNTDDDTSTSTPESQEYFFEENKSIAITITDDLEFTSIIDGNKTVFTYVFIAAQENNIADDEYAEFIHFEIDPSIETFTYTTTDFESITPYFRVSCFCSNHSSQITSGTISGTKIAVDQWDINIDVQFERDGVVESRVITDRFILRE